MELGKVTLFIVSCLVENKSVTLKCSSSSICILHSVFRFLLPLIVRILMLVPGDVPRAVDQVLPSSDALAFAGVIEPLSVRACVLAAVRQSIHGCGRGW